MDNEVISGHNILFMWIPYLSLNHCLFKSDFQSGLQNYGPKDKYFIPFSFLRRCNQTEELLSFLSFFVLFLSPYTFPNTELVIEIKQNKVDNFLKVKTNNMRTQL